MTKDVSFIPPHLIIEYEDITYIERKFDMNFLETETVTARNSYMQYRRLKRNQTDSLFQTLVNKYDQVAVEYVTDLFNRWKSDGYDKKAVQTYEALARKALQIPGKVRDGGRMAAYPSQSHIGIYQDLYRATQAFLEFQVGSEQRIFRGVRQQSIAILTGQAIDKPDADRYYFKTSSISNHTSVWEVARYHSDGIVITWDAKRERVAMAVDQVYHGPNGEDELQIAGGVIHVEPAGVIYASQDINSRKSIKYIAQSVKQPWQMTSELHKEFSDLLFKMVEEGVRLRTKEGANRVRRWEEAAQGQKIFSPLRESTVSDVVDYVTSTRNNVSW